MGRFAFQNYQIGMGKTYMLLKLWNSFAIRQMGESQNVCFKKAKHNKLSEKRTFLTPWYVVLFFLETPVLRFALLPYYRRIEQSPFISYFYFRHLPIGHIGKSQTQPLQLFHEKICSKNFAKFTENICGWVSFLIKLQTWNCKDLKVISSFNLDGTIPHTLGHSNKIYTNSF